MPRWNEVDYRGVDEWKSLKQKHQRNMWLCWKGQGQMWCGQKSGRLTLRAK